MTPAYTPPANKYAEGAHFLIDKNLFPLNVSLRIGICWRMCNTPVDPDPPGSPADPVNRCFFCIFLCRMTIINFDHVIDDVIGFVPLSFLTILVMLTC